jgi:zinc protease
MYQRALVLGLLAAALPLSLPPLAANLSPFVPAPRPAATTAAIFPFPIEARTLPNGLKVVAVPDDSPGIVSLYLVVRTGSRDEMEPGHSGFAHFFEHRMFGAPSATHPRSTTRC